MKKFLSILWLIGAIGFQAAAQEETFGLAQAAYDEGRFEDAAGLYGEMLANDVSNMEVYYNRANAFFKAGNLSEAVWHYREAWYQSPRDPDVRANLQFALNAAGAVEPRSPWFQGFLLALSAQEWIWVAVGCYLVLSLLLIMAFASRKIRSATLRLCLAPLLVLVVAGLGWWQWRSLASRPEAVIVKSGTTALYGPVEGGTAHYKVPLAAVVRIAASDARGWVEIEYDGKAGWIRLENIKRLSP